MNIVFIVTCVVLILMLGVIIIWLQRLRREEKEAGAGKGARYRFRVPKFPDFRGRVAKGIECLSWSMEGGHRPNVLKDAGMEERASFDDRTWGTPNRARKDPRHDSAPSVPARHQTSYAVPWDVPSCRSSCPPALGAFVFDHTDPTKVRATSMSLAMDRALSRTGTPSLETIDEEECDIFVGQQEADKIFASFSHDSIDAPDIHSTYRDSLAASFNLTCGESMSTILTLTAAGMQSIGKREAPTRGRIRQGSDASRSTETLGSTETDSSSDGRSETSSNTSIVTLVTDVSDAEDEDEDDGSDTEEVFELKKVTNSMEVGKGVLLALPKSQSVESVPEMSKSSVIPNPALLMAEHDYSEDLASPYTVGDTKTTDGSFLHPTLISAPSCTSLQTTESIPSVNLDDFPMPPEKTLMPSITFTHLTDTGLVTFPYQ